MKTSKFYVFCDEWNTTFSFISIYKCIYTAYKIIYIRLLQAVQVITK